jgi:hypothetical protein
MGDGRFFRFAVIAVLALLAASVAHPYVTRVLLSDTAPRSVTARGNFGRRTINNRIVRASLTIGGAGCRATGQ